MGSARAPPNSSGESVQRVTAAAASRARRSRRTEPVDQGRLSGAAALVD